ncbi:hypothetical protein MPL1032_130057 [Mesorhizobium plurifarium]|uniref:Uncharacterized protein n=1 Tax=Mesorhizobium plurifarium TaxID=69974 RepID=A0A0K2VQZ1_MESPL|nr:hypothetical protein MPL1032_130057 [Mesorhizobium plurifarium]
MCNQCHGPIMALVLDHRSAFLFRLTLLHTAVLVVVKAVPPHRCSSCMCRHPTWRSCFDGEGDLDQLW